VIGGGRHKGSTSAGGRQSWRELAGGGGQRKRVQSPQARRRRRVQIAKLLAAALICLALIFGLVWFVRSLADREEAIRITTPSKPIARVLFDTDGVLPSRWLGSVIEIRRDTLLMEVNIHALKEQLESQGQVKSASVERQFPDALKIEVREHEPVLRMRVAGREGRPELRIVSRDGTIYEGVGYPEATLNQLPYVSPYVHPEGGIRPLRSIDRVAELLEVARRTQPNFFSTWQLVSLEHFSGDSEMPGEIIEVRTTMIPRLIFGLNLDFAQQLDRLSVIMRYVQERGNPKLKRVDLSLKDSAAVQFESGRISTF